MQKVTNIVSTYFFGKISLSTIKKMLNNSFSNFDNDRNLPLFGIVRHGQSCSKISQQHSEYLFRINYEVNIA